MATSGMAGVPGNIAREGFAVPPKPHPNSVSAVFPKTAPVKIPEGRVATSEDLRRVEANYSKLSQPSDGLQCIFSGFAPKGLLV